MATLLTITGHPVTFSYLIPDPKYFKTLGSKSIFSNTPEHSGSEPLNVANETLLTAQLYFSADLKLVVLILVKSPFTPDAAYTLVFGISVFDVISEECVQSMIKVAMDVAEGCEKLRWKEVTEFLNQLSSSSIIA
ncbi:MAG: hypothetical protein V1891_02150 [bacterium]